MNRLNPEAERSLVERARREPAAFREIYRHCFPKVYAYVSFRVGRVQDTQDVVSEIFAEVVEGLDGFQWRGEGSFAAWLFSIARNLVAGFYRRDRALAQTLPLDELPELASDAILPTDVILQKEKFAYLRQLIGTLSPRRQEVITLKFSGGLRNREIAALLQLDERTVASHLCRGLEELHRKYVDGFVRDERGGVLWASEVN